MTPYDLTLLRRKELVGIVAVIGWGFGLLAGAIFPFLPRDDLLRALAIIVGWTFTAGWVAFDASYRQTRFVAWTFLTLATGPLGFLLYYVSRPATVPVCIQCGRSLANGYQACPTCGYQSFCGPTMSTIKEVHSRLADSLARGPIENTRNTARHMAFAFVGAAVLSLILGHASGPLRPLMVLIYGLSVAAYWVLTAWWVYLDATWRRMDAVPWGFLSLLTNLVGLVTYLVIRYPEPRSCAQCGARLTPELKRCPYCGSETGPVCPHCQAPVRPDWIYCPACAAKLPAKEMAGSAAAQSQASASISIYGSVIDAVSASPIPGAEVRTDSKADARSVTTDAVGRFALTDLAPRPYVLVASAQGYATGVKAYAPSAGRPAQMDFSLFPVAVGVQARETAGTDDSAGPETTPQS
jgi:RNA polymerase subunit RPABC4/transcription elongation factor Spt4